MSTNTNKLDWKGTPGPWYVMRHHGMVYLKSEADDDNVICEVGYNAEPRLDIKMANAHLISANPEAIEFIADWLYGIDGATLTHEAVEKLYERAEEILKKAYNF